MLKGKWIVIKEQRDVARLVFVLFCSKSLFKVFSQMFLGSSFFFCKTGSKTLFLAVLKQLLLLQK